MILDLARFVEAERPHWTALEKTLDWLASDPQPQDVDRRPGAVSHLVSARLGGSRQRSATLASEGELRRYLEWLVSRAYAEIHETRERRRFRPWRWFTVEFPRAFRRHIRAFPTGRGADAGRRGVRRAGAADRSAKRSR